MMSSPWFPSVAEPEKGGGGPLTVFPAVEAMANRVVQVALRPPMLNS